MRIANIVIGERTRREMTNIESLAASIAAHGLLQPPAVAEVDGEFRLVCGARRIAAMKHLGWTETRVTIVQNLTDELAVLMAEGEENTEREPFTIVEAVEHRRRIQVLEARLAKERQRESGPASAVKRQGDGSAKFAEPSEKPHERTARHRAAKATGYSAPTLDKAEAIMKAASAPETPAPVRQVAEAALVDMTATGRVDGAYRRFKDAEAVAASPAPSPLVDGFLAADKNIQDLKYVHSFLRALGALSSVLLFDAERLGDLLDHDEAAVLAGHVKSFDRFNETVTRRRTGLRLINGGSQ